MRSCPQGVRLLRRTAAVLLAGTCLGTAALAQDATWVAGGPVADWNDNANWAPATVPSGIATFNGAGSAGIVFTNAVTTVQTLNFTPGLQVYTFDICVCQEFRITGAGIINPSAPAPVFAVDGGRLLFRNNSTAGNAIVANVGGSVDFNQSSSAGTADITNRAFGITTFNNSSSAANATITNRAFSATDFMRSSNAGHADITNNGAFSLTQFFNDANAAFATITNRNGGGTLFFDMSKAGTATITNRDSSGTSFENRSSADHADITNSGGITLFFNQATAGSAIITNRNGGVTIFNNRTTAEDATIITRTGSFVQFFDRSTGGNARFITDLGGFVDFSETKGLANDGRISAGSIEGGGTYFIGAGNILSVGGNNLSTEVSGVIADFNPCGCATPGPGTLEKVGLGTLILSGTNTYSGGTRILAGVLQLGNGGATGTILGNVLNDAIFAINRSDVYSFGGVISGLGALQQNGTGTTVFTAANTYTGGTVINAGTLRLGPGGSLAPTGALTVNLGATFDLNGHTQTVGDFSGAGNVMLGMGALTAGIANSTVFSGVMSGPGSFTKVGTGTLTFAGANTYTGGTLVDAGTLQLGPGGSLAPTGALTVNLGGTFDLNGFTQTVGDLSGAGNVMLGMGALTAGTANSTVFSGVMSGPGSFTKVGTGTLTFAGANTYTGGTIVTAGTLQLGPGGSLAPTGALVINLGAVFDLNGQVQTVGDLLGAGNVLLGNGALTAGTANSTVFSGVMSGPGMFTKAGSGTLVFSGANTYTGPTTVAVGTLMVNGTSLSPTTVNPGATLGGTGTVGPVTNSGTFSPGNSIGTITVNGGMTFVGAGNYLVEVSPTAADRTNVNGTAGLAGTLTAVFAPGTYNFAKTYTILSATGGRTGTFTTFVPIGLTSPLVTPVVTYTATDVLLSVAPNLAAFAGPTVNAQSVANALNTGWTAAGDPGAFTPLFGLTPASLPNVLAQLAGEIATGTPTASFKVMDQFLGLMLDPFLETRLGDGTTSGRALSLAPENEATVLPAALSAFGPMVTKAPPASLIDRRWTVWGAAYGAQGKFDGDALVGSHKLDARNGGFAGGIDYRVSRDSVLGVAVTGAATNWTLDGLAGSGRGETVQVGAYASTRFDNAYVSAAFAYGRHDIATDRTAAFPGVLDRLAAGFAADSYGGRIEAGYRFALGQGFGITPYAAAQALSLHTPAYAERDLTGLAAFALTYAGKTTTDLRSELGARFDARMMLDNGATLILRGRAAWAHGFDTDRSVAAIFQVLPGAGFTVTGASAAENAALVSAGAELKLRNGVALSAKFDGEFSERTAVYAGTGTLRVSW